MPEILRTERLALRTWEPTDVELLIQLCARPGLTDYSSGSYSDLNPEKAAAFLERERIRFAEGKGGRFAVSLLTAPPEPIGITGIFARGGGMGPRDFEINYRFPRDCWGKGYGVESARGMIHYGFTAMKLPTVYALVREDNPRSQRVLERVGMTHRDRIEYEGKSFQRWAIDATPN